MEARAPQKASWRNWLAGLLADLMLFALFLAVGLALLNVLIAVIVLVVGLFQEPAPSTLLMEQFGRAAEREAGGDGRLKSDAIGLGLSLAWAAAAVGGYWLYARLRRKYLHLFMGIGFESFVSKRYLIAREGGRLVGLITTVSVAGVAVGVMALIVVISVMEGFDRELVRKFMGVFSHVQVMADVRQGTPREIPEDVYTGIIEMLQEKEYVEGIAPIFDYETVVQRNRGDLTNPAFAMIRGIDPALEEQVTDFMDYVETGKRVPGDNEVVIGQQLARNLGVYPGDSIYALGKVVETANTTRAKTTKLKVVGIFHSGLYDVDDKFIYTNLKTVQNMRVVGDVVTSVHLKVDDPQRALEYARAFYDELPDGYAPRTWDMMNRQFFEALWMEKVAMFIILLLIVLVAALNIIGTLVMTVVQKTRDIGVLKSMGATNGMILRIFLMHGFLIGLLGTSLGIVWGLRICDFVHRDIEKIFRLPGGVYGIDRLPVVIDPWLIVFMGGCALTICIVASIVPAYQAARLNPVEALRYD